MTIVKEVLRSACTLPNLRRMLQDFIKMLDGKDTELNSSNNA